MPIVFDPTPATGDSFEYGGKTWLTNFQVPDAA